MDETIAWQPHNVADTKLYHFMRFLEKRYHIVLPNYQALHQWSIKNLAYFWESVGIFFDIAFDTPANSILQISESMQDATWFEGARLNFAAHLLRHTSQDPALICIDESGRKETIDFYTLKMRVAEIAAGMRAMGVQPHDRVVGILGNNAYAMIGMLASASIGAVWSSCSPDFGSEAIVDRLTQIQPKLLFSTASYTYQGKPYVMHDKIKALQKNLPSLEKIVICDAEHSSLPGCTIWSDFALSNHALTFESLPFNHPLYILFSSGTTGQPKCIVHGVGGTLLQHLKELGLHTNLSEQDKLLFYTTCGWMMWNWMASALALGTTLVLYDGAPTYPNMTRLFDIIEQEQVTVLGTSAKYLASLEHAEFSWKQKKNSLRTILSTGSPLLPTQYDYVRTHIASHIQLSSISGGTDIISCFALGNPISPVYRGELQCLGLGMAVQVYNDNGQTIQQQVGELVCTAPFPSMPLYFYNDPQREKYTQAYFSRFPGIWTHGDFAEITIHQGLIIHGRSDATLNPGGVRIGTAEIYRQLEHLTEIQDSVVIGQEWHGDTRIVLFVTLKPGMILDDGLKNKICQTLRQHASPRHVPAKIIAVPDIPRTINGKTVEIAVRQVVHGQQVAQLGALANPDALLYFKDREELSVD
jgi:acetoacetyl-CoA synthetase